jgi:SAM-dependent methyltransferase
MAHQQQTDFCNSVKRSIPQFFSKRLVLDVGSLDVNGNNQHLFDDCLYLGVDLLPGRNVDLAAKGHELNLPDECVDVVISTECFEHDRFYQLTLKNIVRMLKPGGLFIFTCATTGRPEHGTWQTSPEDAPFTQQFGDWANYYKNLDESEIRSVLEVDAIFDRYEFSSDVEAHDLYFWGVKKGALLNRCDYSFQLRASEQRNRLKSMEIRVADLQGTVSEQQGTISEQQRAISEQQKQLTDVKLAMAKAVAERNRSISALSAQLAAMTDSKTWKLAMLLRKCRVAIAPPHSRRARAARRLKNAIVRPS